MMKLETETEMRSKNTPAITAHAIGAAKDNKMKIFEILTLTLVNLSVCLYVTVWIWFMSLTEMCSGV